MNKICIYLQVLDKARKRLSDVVQERTRVLDLICHAIPSVSVSAGPLTQRTGNFGTLSYSQRPSSVCGMSPVQEVDPLGAYTPEVDAALRDAKEARDRSAERLLRCTVTKKKWLNGCMILCGENANLGLVAFLFLTDICVINSRSLALRKEAANTLGRNNRMMKSALKAVNDGLTQKVAETVTLKVRLPVIIISECKF